MDKNDWLTQIRLGNQTAFRHFYETYSEYAIRTALAITRNQEMAKDAVQETFIRIYHQIDRYNTTLPFDPWFYRILTNECMRLLKKNSLYSKFECPELENKQLNSTAPFHDVTDLYEAIQTLDEPFRIPLILKYLKGFTEKEIAAILDLNQNTVKSRLFKGRKRLKNQLDLNEKEADFE